MDRIPTVSRRGVLKAAGVVVGASQATGATIGEPIGGSPATAEVTQGTEVTEDVTVTLDRETDTVRYTFEYQIPSKVDEFDVSFSLLNVRPFRTVVEKQSFERDQGASDESRFVWDGKESPRLVVEDDLSASSFQEVGYYTDTELFLSGVPKRDTRRTVGSQKLSRYTLEGEGYVNDDLLYVGPHESAIRVVDGTELAVVVPDWLDAEVDLQRRLDLLEEWYTLLGGVRLSHSATAYLPVPSERTEVDGLSVGGSFYVSSDRWTLDGIDNVVTHEFAHTVFGTFGSGKMYWFKEAVAEYYGYLLALNTGVGDFDEFLGAVEAADQYRDSKLTDDVAMRNSLADYSKGAHVLAALDAEIRRQSDDAQSLLSIFEIADNFDGLPLKRYSNFRGFVNRTAPDGELSEWVDQYVDGSALPEVTEQREQFRFRGRAVPRELSIPAGTLQYGEPFDVEVKIDPIRRVDGTVPVEVFLNQERVVRRDVEITGEQPDTVTFAEVDFPELDGSEYRVGCRVGGYFTTENLLVSVPPEFTVFGIDMNRTELRPTEPLTVEVDIRNSGDTAGTTELELILISDDTEYLLEQRSVEVEKLETNTVVVEEIDVRDIEPGEYSLLARVNDSEEEQSVEILEPVDSQGDGENATDSPEDTEAKDAGDDGFGTGFGIGPAIMGIGGLTYTLKRRLGTDQGDDR